VALPEEWEPAGNWEPDQGVLDVIDPEHTRELSVSIRKLRPQTDNPQGDTEQQVVSRTIQPVPFGGLHQNGIMAIVPRYERESGDNIVAHDVLVALTVLPSGELIEIELRKGGQRIGPADQLLVETVANAITRRPPRNMTSRPAAG
jgi:hypothetical protein